MTKEEKKLMQIAARTPEVKQIMEHLLNNLGPQIMHTENEQVFKGFMMAYYAIAQLQNTNITEE